MMFMRRKLAKITKSIYLRVYVEGWGGWIMPRSIRKLIAGSQIHRAWFLGYNGYFEEDGVAYGLARPYAEMLENRRREHIKEWEEAREQERALEMQIHHDQWDDYYEYTGMTDLARELRAEEESSVELLSSA